MSEAYTTTGPERHECPPPGEVLLRLVRGRLIAKGTSLRAWAIAHGAHPENVRACLIGSWNGPRGQALRQRIVSDALSGGLA